MVCFVTSTYTAGAVIHLAQKAEETKLTEREKVVLTINLHFFSVSSSAAVDLIRDGLSKKD